jgi:hypothetical protein
LLYILRWFWWRINAWCEVVAMASSFAASVVLLVVKKVGGVEIDTADALLITVAFTTVCWMLAAFLAPGTDRETLASFYKLVRPFGPGWKRVRREAGALGAADKPSHENIPLSLLGWAAGCAAIWSSLFTVGSFLYGRTALGLGLGAIFLVSGAVLVGVVNRLWSK